MADNFLSEIRLMSFGYAPRNWAQCDGQLLPINQNQALFSLLGTIYGGDGRTNFGLPDLQGRVPMHRGGVHTLGERGGEQTHTLSILEVPTHVHQARAQSAAADAAAPGSALVLAATVPTAPAYAASSPSSALGPAALANTGGSQAHQNLQPFLTLNFCIALQGIFPSQT